VTRNEMTVRKEKLDFAFDENEISQVKGLLKNE
jgi:hypothetical protein